MPFWSSSHAKARKAYGKGKELYDRGRFQDAEKKFTEALAYCDESLSPDHPDTLNIKHWLGQSFSLQGKQVDAEKYLRQALHGRQNTLSSYDGSLLSTKHSLGQCLYRQDRYAEAETYLRQAMEWREKAFSPDGDETLYSKYWLGLSLCRQGKPAEAETYFRYVCRIYEKTLGSDQPRTLLSIHWLGRSLFEQMKYSEAESYIRHAFQESLKGSSPTNFDALCYQHWVGRWCHEQQQYEEAEDCYRQAMQGIEKLGREEAICDSKYWLGRLLLTQRKYDEAETHLRYAANGPKHQYKVSSQEWLATCRAMLQQRIETQTDPPERVVSEETTDLDDSVRSNSDNSLAKTPTTNPPVQLVHTSTRTPATCLDQFFSGDCHTRPPYSDSEISEITSLLKLSKPQWSQVPRTYVVLRWIDHLHLLDDFIANHFSDYWLPASVTRLPQCLSPDQRQEFVNTQRLILSESLELEKGAEGKHCYFKDGKDVPIEKKRILGRGGFGQVDEVLSLISYKTYARKRVLRGSLMRGRKPELLKLFVTEIETLKRLKHKHIVEFIGSYTDPKYLGLLIHPVAEMDLSIYLMQSDISMRLFELRTFFGCLAAALAYLHENKVRHKDIKPKNILVNRGNVLLTDFGLALDFTGAEGSTTMTMVNTITPRYCAPEVVSQGPRDTSSDIWSLGVVFLEMLVVIKGQTLEYMNEFFTEHGSGHEYVRENHAALTEFLAILAELGSRGDNRIGSLVGEMLQIPRKLRPTADSLMSSLNDSPADEQGQTKFGGICCVPRDDDAYSDFSDYYSDDGQPDSRYRADTHGGNVGREKSDNTSRTDT